MVHPEFLSLPSPWQEHNTVWSKEAGIQLLIKRDDLIHSLVSGNKWRKLSAYLDNSEGLRKIKTFGGAYSNHLVACAALTAKLGLQSLGVIRGERPARLSTVLSFCQHLGMQLEFVDRESYKRVKDEQSFKDGILCIPEGGKGQLGTLGCHDILTEQNISLDHCVVACGTGTTLAGMAPIAEELSIHMIGVPVIKGGSGLSGDIAMWSQGSTFELWDEFHFGGYAKTPESLFQFIQEFTEETGILLDPIYTSKAFYAVKQKAQSGYFKPGERVGLIHTGGLTGWYGKWAYWAKKDPNLMARV